MARNKKQEFSEDEVSLAEMAKAIAHPARIAILKVLAEKKTCICGEIVEVLPLAQSTVSQHLKELKAVGLIKGTIDGPRSCYCIHKENIQHFAELFNTMVDIISVEEGKCC